MASVKFDNTEIVNSTYIPRYVKHESTPDRDLALMKLAREDGAVLISEKYGVKKIIVIGKLTAASRSALETAIDSFKELFSRKEKNLDIGWAGSTRRYVATCVRHDFNRDHFHDHFVPWTAEFLVAAGVGKDTALTALEDGVDADPPHTDILTFAGSAKPKPVITLTFGTNWATAHGIKFENTDKDEEIIITRSTIFAENDVLIVNCETKTVTLNGTEIEFYRVFPTFDIGANNISITAGDIIDQAFTNIDNEAAQAIVADTYRRAESFTVPHTDATYQGIKVRLKTDAETTGDVVVKIETDSGGNPSGSQVTNASFTIPAASIGTSMAWVFANSASKFTLNANTVYWVVISATGTHYNTKTSVVTGTDANYGRGHGASSTDSGANWTHGATSDMPFQLFFGGKVDDPVGNLTLDVDYYKRYL